MCIIIDSDGPVIKTIKKNDKTDHGHVIKTAFSNSCHSLLFQALLFRCFEFRTADCQTNSCALVNHSCRKEQTELNESMFL